MYSDPRGIAQTLGISHQVRCRQAGRVGLSVLLSRCVPEALQRECSTAIHPQGPLQRYQAGEAGITLATAHIHHDELNEMYYRTPSAMRKLVVAISQHHNAFVSVEVCAQPVHGLLYGLLSVSAADILPRRRSVYV